jgi:outer membrane receptor protein involved in Fe transport
MNGLVNYVASAFWNDVLDLRFHGPTDAFTMVNAYFGVKWLNGRLITGIRVNNLLNQTVQEHVFGDIIRRSAAAQVRFAF